MKNKWIKIEDKLPDKSGYYLVYDKESKINKIHVKFYSNNAPLNGCFLNYDELIITHWMNLPDIPYESLCTCDKSKAITEKLIKKLRKIHSRMEKLMKNDKWIGKATKNKGALHRELGVPEGKKIPAKKLAKAAKSTNPKIRKQVALAKTLKKLRK